MKIVDAIWEVRNLGLNAFEVEIEEGDGLSEIQLAVDKFKDFPYVVFKVPIASLNINELLNKNGYLYAEALCNLGVSLKDYLLPNKIVKLNSKVQHIQVDEKLLNVICEKIEENIFTTDRIALDKLFGLNASNRRYSNWIRDEFFSGRSKIYEIQLGNKGIGFFCLKEGRFQTVDLFLAGMYNEAKGFGLGFSMISKSIEESMALEYRHLQTHVSTNNLEVLKLYLSLGFNLLDIKNIFVKHG